MSDLILKTIISGPGGDVASSEPSNESPIITASFPSKLVFSWFTGFAWTGFKRSLGFADLYDLPPYIQSGNVVPRFLEKWNQNQKEVPKSPSPKKSSTPTTVKVCVIGCLVFYWSFLKRVFDFFFDDFRC